MALPELADGVVIGLPVSSDHPESNILVISFFNLAGTRNAGAISVEEKSCHHPGIVRRLSPAVSLVGYIYL
jgi:hypothetical protein